MSSRPTHIGPYAIQRVLGRGGMGIVYLALDPRLGRHVAIKLLREDIAADSVRLARLKREARVLASLNHPNVATLYALGRTAAGTPYLILEFLEGRTLAAELADGPLPVDRARNVALQVARALEAAHARGIVHRDLKPANVMLGSDGRVKVFDFGIAQQGPSRVHGAATTSLDLNLTQPGHVLGTPGYLSPEQWLGLPADQRTDVFGLGALLFESLTGERPLSSPASAPDWSTLPASTPPALRALIVSALERNPGERPSDMTEFARRLEEPREAHPATGAVPRNGSVRSTAAGSHGAARKRAASLPAALSSFIGRERELAQCEELLADARLLTLTGPAGSGKTRLALAIAERSEERGAWFVDFAALQDPVRVASHAAAAIGLRVDAGASVSGAIVEHLATSEGLLVLDNCEHVLAVAAELARSLLASCPDLALLATSREPLGVPGEQTYPVPTLELPASREAEVGAIAATESVRLFVERARQVCPSFAIDTRNAAVIGDICRHLDGIPLAIELAAARVRVLGVEDIRRRLDDRFRLLTGGARTSLPRHRTLHAAIQWSYDQLTPTEQRLFRSLGVFAGGWTLDSVLEVCAENAPETEVVELLTRLVEKSLVQVEPRDGGHVRYRFLESVRHFALECLEEAGGEEEMRERHLACFARLAEQGGPAVIGPDQALWLGRLEEDHENLLAALDWCARAEGCATRCLHLCSVLWRFWYAHGHFTVGRAQLARALARPDGTAPSVERAGALSGAALLAYWQADYDAADALYEESLEIGRRLHDLEAVGRAFNGLGAVAASARGHMEAARRYFDGSLAAYEQAGQPHGVAVALHNLSDVAFWQGDFESARTLAERALRIRRELGDEQGIARTLSSLALVAVHEGDRTRAAAALEESIRLARKQGHLGIGVVALEATAALAAQSGEPGDAARFLSAADRERRTLRLPPSVIERGALEALRTQLRSVLGELVYETFVLGSEALSFDRALEEAATWIGPGSGIVA
ncbi:MAG: protein kinase domain-containing protein [Candidatus Eiseniibacteriota bacterium]